MKWYLAPMEGITGFVYRNAYHKYFAPFDKYFTPFLSPNPKGRLAPQEIADLLPDHNRNLYVVPQILTNRADDFIRLVKILQEDYGYQEVNLNLGCPSKTVVSKYRGAGFLEKVSALDQFLQQIFENVPIEISIKTRIGRWDADEWDALLNVYRQYPLKELIVHPRVQKDYYNNKPNLDAFKKVYEQRHFQLCYNGDIFEAEDYAKIFNHFPELQQVMVGRGVLRDPSLLGKCIKNDMTTMKSYIGFHDALLEGYLTTIHGEQNAIFKMKEIWGYFSKSFEENQEGLHRIRMSNDRKNYQEAVNLFFEKAVLRGGMGEEKSEEIKY